MQDKKKSHDQCTGNPLDDLSRGSERLCHSLSTASEKGKGVFHGSGDISLLMRNLDWSATPIGPVEHWSQSLRTSVSICLASRFPILIWWGSQLVMLYNDAYRPMLGATKHPQALGQRGRECWLEVWDIIGPMLEGVLTTGIATWSDDQLLLLDRNGYLEECYFTFSYSPILDDTGLIGGIFTVVKETTEQVLSERRLRTLRELAAKTANAKTTESACRCAVQTLATNPADIPFALLYMLDEAGQHAQLFDVVGLTPEVLASSQNLDLITINNNTWTSFLARVVQTGQAEQVDNLTEQFEWASLLTAVDFPNSALVLPIAQVNQVHPAGLLVMGISPRRALDNEYRGFLELIAGHVATAIANARAYEAERKRAEALAELDRAKTTFFSNISHEFRTPLTLMIGPLEDLLTKGTDLLPPEDLSQLQAVYRNSMRLLKLVNSLLDFSRIEAGRVQAVYEPTDLAMLTTNLAGVFRSAIEHAGMRLVVDCPPLPEPAYVDRQTWEKIVLNLLSNAFKFTFEGEIEVSLRWARDHFELKVRDTGIGIPALDLPKIFERFHRVQDARGRTNEGSGIGLSLVQELIKLHGGTVEVTSVVDGGTSFIVSIPTGYAHLPSDRIGATRTLASTVVGGVTYVEEALRWLPEVGGERAETKASDLSLPVPVQTLQHTPTARILVADDNADMREYVQRLLLSQHYQVETVTDGIAALAAVRQQMPDLILTDVMMPRLDGLGLLRDLRADRQTREIPIILLSARAGEESRIEGLETGADDYLIKPFSARELLARVEANLKMAQMRQETARREQALRIEAETANRVKDEFLAVLSHELRSPLNPIMGWSKLLRSRKLDEKTTDLALETIERNARVQTQLIEDLLDISRILRGKLALDVSPVNLESTIQAAMETVYLAAQAKSIQLQSVSSSEVVQVLGDANRLQQVVWNLLSNAVKFTDSGGRVEIRLERTRTHAQIQVSDTGRGIHPDFLPYVFDYFRQENSTTTRKFGGLGLGLAIVRQLTEMHGGTVQAFSLGEGQGATFTVRLPLTNVEQEMSENTQVFNDTRGLENIRILIVDDDVDTLEFLVFLLKQDGAQVRAVGSAQEALDVFAQWQPEILLSDIGMPEVDGYKLLRQIRAMPPLQGGQIPAIALTAYAGETDHQKVLLAGFHTHLTKPIDPAELAAVITALIKVKKE